MCNTREKHYKLVSKMAEGIFFSLTQICFRKQSSVWKICISLQGWLSNWEWLWKLPFVPLLWLLMHRRNRVVAQGNDNLKQRCRFLHLTTNLLHASRCGRLHEKLMGIKLVIHLFTMPTAHTLIISHISQLLQLLFWHFDEWLMVNKLCVPCIYQLTLEE